MTITIIGKISTKINYKDWSNALKSAIDFSLVSAFNITGGQNMLNNFVREFCKDYNIRLVVWKLTDTDNSESAKLLRNQQMIADCDKVIAFMADDSTVNRSTIVCRDVEYNSVNKPVVIINLSKFANHADMSGIIHRERADFPPEEINKDELITVE